MIKLSQNYLKILTPIWIIASLVIFGWQGLEYLIEGEITPRSVDSIISIILILSLWLNYALLKPRFQPKKSL